MSNKVCLGTYKLQISIKIVCVCFYASNVAIFTFLVIEKGGKKERKKTPKRQIKISVTIFGL